jgi:hypothetical protein
MSPSASPPCFAQWPKLGGAPFTTETSLPRDLGRFCLPDRMVHFAVFWLPSHECATVALFVGSNVPVKDRTPRHKPDGIASLRSWRVVRRQRRVGTEARSKVAKKCQKVPLVLCVRSRGNGTASKIGGCLLSVRATSFGTHIRRPSGSASFLSWSRSRSNASKSSDWAPSDNALSGSG